MAYLTGTKAGLSEARDALARAEGMPRMGTVYLDGVPQPEMTAQIIPAVYSPGVPGWTDHVCNSVVEAGAACALEIPAEVERHLGTSVGAVTLPARTALKEESALSSALQTKIRERRGDAGAVDPRVKTADGRDVADGSGRPVTP